MTEEEKKSIEDFKRVIANYFSYSSYDWFYSDLVKTGIKGTIQNTFADMINLIEKLKKENENLKIDLEKANASIVDQTDKDNEIEHLENLLRGNLYDGYLYYKDIAREYQKNYALIEELKNKVDKRNNELIELEETSEKEFLTKQEVKENYIPKDKIRNFIEKHKDNFYDGTANGCDYIDYEVIKEFIEEE